MFTVRAGNHAQYGLEIIFKVCGLIECETFQMKAIMLYKVFIALIPELRPILPVSIQMKAMKM